METVSLLIKPVSSGCNLSCDYCFYHDVASRRAVKNHGALSSETLERLIMTGMRAAKRECVFSFQGGEPTLAGLDFFKRVIALEEKHNLNGIIVRNAIQTNGYLINERWARFFAERRFLVGVSLDGAARRHNAFRKTDGGDGTWEQALRACRLLAQYRANFNILCVVTGETAKNIRKTYLFFKNQGFRWLQFIPCLEPLEAARGEAPYALGVDDYADYLIEIFSLWLEDLRRGDYISIRHIDNWIRMLAGEAPELCGLSGHCALQYVVESDGGVYPCDFYVTDEWRMGTIGQGTLDEMSSGDVARRFLTEGALLPDTCVACPAYALCRNGCRRDRVLSEDGLPGRNYYCAAYRRFFETCADGMREALALVARMRG